MSVLTISHWSSLEEVPGLLSAKYPASPVTYQEYNRN